MSTGRLSELSPDQLCPPERRARILDLIKQADGMHSGLLSWARDVRRLLDAMNTDLENLGLDEEDIAQVTALTSAGDLTGWASRLESAAASVNGTLQ